MIEKNLAAIKERIEFACGKENRDPLSVRVVAICKGRSVEDIRRVLQCGITDIGENRVQEAMEKCAVLSAEGGIRWHMVGHLQGNKARDAVHIFDLIHSVDSLKLAADIDRHAAAAGKVQRILAQVNISAEGSKSGFSPAEVPEAIKKMFLLRNIRVEGLMTIAPHFFNPEEAQPFFSGLRVLMQELNYSLPEGQKLDVLSMGMSEDFETALSSGANMLRLGRIIFEGIGL